MSLRLALKRSLLEKESSSSQSQHSSSSSSAVVATPTTNNNTAHNNNNNKKKKKKQSSLSSQENKSTKNYHKKQKITKNNNDTTNSSTIVATTLLPNSMSTCIANTTTMPSSSSALISSSCQETSYNNNNYYNNNHHNNHINIPQPPKQKYSIGTSIEKDFIDPLTNKSRTYHATIERYEYVLQKRKWMYYVFYEDGEGEHLVESAIKKHLVKKKQLENDPKKLFIQYFGGLLFVNANPNNERRRRVPSSSSSSSSRGQQMMNKKKKKDINWNMFLEDLERVPDLASINDYQSMGQQQQRHTTTTTTNDTTNTTSCSGAYPLQYALLYGDDVPMVVIEKLIELNWEAVGFIDDHYGYDTLSWMMMFRRRRRNNDDNGCCCCFRFLEPNNINPNILELVLKESYENVEEFHSNRLLTQTFITTTNNNNDDDDDNEEMNECTTTIDYMIDQVGHINPSIIEVIFKYSPPSVAWVLIRHFKSEKIVSSHILTLALKAACDFERYNNNNDNDDDVVVENKHATTTTTTFFDENWFDVDSDYTSVWNDIVLGLDGTDNDNVELFHSYVKAMATVILQKRRDDRYNNNNHNHDDDDDNDGLSRRRDRETTVSVDDFSICLPSCVLYCLSEWETNLDHLWNTFAEKCPTELLRCVGDNGHHGGPAAGSGSMMTKQGRMNNPLHVAIRLGFQYEPVIKSLVEANNNDNDDECLLDSLDSIEHLPPVLLAAATTPVAAANQQSSFPRESKNLMGTSYLSENEYLHLNHINNTYNLLLANPSILKTTTAITMDDEQQDPQAATSTIGVGTNQGWDDNFDYF